jgi:hypothetical protein
MKSFERNAKSDPLKGEGKLWEPNLSLGRKIKFVYKQDGHAPCSCYVTKI